MEYSGPPQKVTPKIGKQTIRSGRLDKEVLHYWLCNVTETEPGEVCKTTVMVVSLLDALHGMVDCVWISRKTQEAGAY